MGWFMRTVLFLRTTCANSTVPQQRSVSLESHTLNIYSIIIVFNFQQMPNLFNILRIINSRTTSSMQVKTQ
jgi:hypothetical protein